VTANGWRRAKATLHHDASGELRRRFLLECVRRNRNPQLRQRALAEIAARRDAEGFDEAIEIIGGWSREERREGAKTMLQALAERRIGRRDADVTRERELEAATEREAVDSGDDRLPAAVHRLPEVEAAPLLAEAHGDERLHELADVGAGGERALARARHDDDFHVLVARDAVEATREIATHRLVHGVVDVGTVERDRGHVLGHGVSDGLVVAHRITFRLRSSSSAASS
jgi:hypothetical protein